jgi:NADPH:quinone reductase-like Zn-dependent oxidoreductase
VLVRVRAAGVNPSDVKAIEGRMEFVTLPRTPGRDFAGVVEAVGPGTPPDLVGRAVWGTGGDVGFTRDGSHAQLLVIPAAAARDKPGALSFEQAAACGVNFVTAYVGLFEAAKLRPGLTVLVTGASGGVGSAVVQLAKWKGATVVAASRRGIDVETARQAGIDEVVNLAQDDLVQRVHQITAGRGVDVAFDTVGGPLFEPCSRCLGQMGKQIAIASTGERRVGLDLVDFYRRRLTLMGVDTRHSDVTTCAAFLEVMRPGFEDGSLHAPHVLRTAPLEEAASAYQDVERGTDGKIVLVPG